MSENLERQHLRMRCQANLYGAVASGAGALILGDDIHNLGLINHVQSFEVAAFQNPVISLVMVALAMSSVAFADGYRHHSCNRPS